MWRRFISDLRDLWMLITRQEVTPATPPSNMPTPYLDLDKWEAEQFARNPLAFWFDPLRYGPVAPKVQSANTGGMLQTQCFRPVEYRDLQAAQIQSAAYAQQAYSSYLSGLQQRQMDQACNQPLLNQLPGHVEYRLW